MSTEMQSMTMAEAAQSLGALAADQGFGLSR